MDDPTTTVPAEWESRLQAVETHNVQQQVAMDDMSLQMTQIQFDFNLLRMSTEEHLAALQRICDKLTEDVQLLRVYVDERDQVILDLINSHHGITSD